MKKIAYSFIFILNFSVLILCRSHGLRNFGSTCYINSLLQAFDALDPVTAYLLTQNNPYKREVGLRPPEAGLGFYYVDFLKKLYALPATPPNIVHAANTLDTVRFVHEFKRNILESSEDEGTYISIENSNVQEFPFELRDKNYIIALAQFYNTSLAEFLYRSVYRSVDPLPTNVNELLAACPQADVPEFIERLISALIEQDSRYSFMDTTQALHNHPLGKIFRIEIKKTRECPGYKDTLIEQESRLNLQTMSNDEEPLNTLQSCLNNILSASTIEYRPPGFAQKQLCIQQPQLTHLSNIVILTLNRFIWGPSGGMKYKHSITMPLAYNFAQHLPEEYKEQTEYELIAVIEHIGEFGSGHYIAYTKRENQWYICNDEHIFAVDTSAIADYSNTWGAGRKEHRGLNYGYVYFYQKSPTSPIKEPVDKEKLKQTLQELTQQLTILKNSLALITS